MTDDLITQHLPEVRHDRSPARLDYEIRGLRCPVDRCDGVLEISSYSVITEPEFIKQRVMNNTWQMQALKSIHGWVEIEYFCQECQSSGHMKAWMKMLPELVETDEGRKWVVRLGRPPARGI